MFAVPGWSLAVDKPKLQVEGFSKDQNAGRVESAALIAGGDVDGHGHGTGDGVGNGDKVKKGKKRKRSGRDRGVTVTTDNVAEMWERYVEGGSGGLAAKKTLEKERGVKKSKNCHPGAESGKSVATEGQDTSGAAVTGEESMLTKKKTLKEKKREKKARLEAQDGGALEMASTNGQATELEQAASPFALGPRASRLAAVVPTNPVQALPGPEPKLTPLQSSMRQKLISSRFRHLNQTLYTTPSPSSLELFRQNPSFFAEYHEGFRRQVESWPENPVDGFVRWVLERGRARGKALGAQKAQFRKMKRGKDNSTAAGDNDYPASNVEPLPRNPSGLCTIADLGCGEAPFAQALTAHTTKLKLKILSYDLSSPNKHVTLADIAYLPLADGSVDVAIFCLALMGTNWIDFVEEAWRVLRWKGECWIGEVGSRFVAGSGGKIGGERRVEHSVGLRTKDAAKRKGKHNHDSAKAPAEQVVPGLEDQALAEEEGDALGGHDGLAHGQTRTDVSAFVGVLERRGFVLQGEPETGNKMFVRMRFVKSGVPVVGKNVGSGERRNDRSFGGAEGGRMSGMGRAGAGAGGAPKRFIDGQGRGAKSADMTVEEEAKVLKACVYKTR